MIARAPAVIAVCVPLALAGCDGRAPEPSAPSTDASAATTTASDSVVTVALELSDTSITTAQRTRLAVTTTADEAVDVTPPDYERVLEDWSVTPRRERDRSVRSGRVIVERAYRLEPFLPGEYAVPALTFAWTDTRTDESGEITTDPMAVTVASVLDEGSGGELADIKPVATPQREVDWWTVALIAAGVAVVVGAIVVLLIRRLTRVQPMEIDRVPAHEVALSQLDAIDPSFSDQYGERRFFEDASNVVRTYIEDRFGLHAPERTTEEFLRESAVHEELSRGDLDLLERFLGLCDLVKFARKSVDASDAQRTLEAARSFVERTGDLSCVVRFNRKTGARLGVETLGAGEGGSP